MFGLSETMETVQDTEMLKEIVEKSGDGLLVVDDARVIHFLNPAAAMILNQPREDLIGKPFAHPVHSGTSAEMEIQRKNGKLGTGEIHSVPINWNGSQVHLVSIRDVTERIVFDRLKDDFIRTVSHELRTPLTSLREAISVLKDGVLGEVNDEQKDFLYLCLRNTDLLKRIVTDLLDISKIETGQVRLQKKKSDFCGIVRETLATFSPMIESKGLRTTLSIPDHPIEVFVDKDRIVQVLNNLVGNALKFTPAGSIGVSISEEENRVRCAVQDTGRGIAESDLPNVFQKFQQFGEAIDPENRGTGLGLAIAKEIVELHGGHITAESRIERGSTFTFSLPKFNSNLLLLDAIQNRIQESKEPFILFRLDFLENPEVLTEALIERIAHKMDMSFKISGNPAVPVPINDHEIYFLINHALDSPQTTASRIVRLVKEALIEQASGLEPDFEYGIAGYPRDGHSAEYILQAIASFTRREREERLRKRIFLVDDEAGITESLKTLLGIFGYGEIEEFRSGNAVFDILDDRTPELVILDMHMPGMSGYEVVGRLKERHATKDIPIIIMSGYEVQEGLFSEYISKKAILTLNKPVKAELLKKMVYYLLS